MQAEARRKRGRSEAEDASDRVSEEHARNRGRPESLVGGAGDHEGVEQGLGALLDAASAAGKDRAQRLSALLELQRRCASPPVATRGCARQVLEALKVHLRQHGAADAHAQCICVGALENLACAMGLADESGAGGDETVSGDIVQEVIETASKLPARAGASAEVRVVERCLLALLRIGEARPALPRPGLGALVALTLRQGNAACRAVSLDLIAQSHVSVAGQDGRAVVLAYLADGAQMVRVAALRALRTSSVWRPSPPTLLPQVIEALSDDEGLVRREAVKLIGVIGIDNPEPLPDGTEVGGAQRVRVPDACFMAICDAFFDSDRWVREEACRVLGLVPGVSVHYLVQTLSKKMLSHTQLADVEQTAQEAEGDYRVADETALLSAEAAGAFVVALEDEFWQVRAAAIGSMASLALESRTFRTKCLDSLVDMLSDEIEKVRIAALLALGRLRHRIEFSEVHLQVVLSVMDDVSSTLRAVVHRVLGTIPLTSPGGLYMAIKALQDNIRRYPSDTPNVFKALARLGALCSGLAEEVTPRLLVHRNPLGQESPYVTVQPDAEDDTYVAILVLVFSAAVLNPQVLAMVPGHCLRHWRYLRHKYASIIPAVEIAPVGHQMLEFQSLESEDEEVAGVVTREGAACFEKGRAVLVAATEWWKREVTSVMQLPIQPMQQQALALTSPPRALGNLHGLVNCVNRFVVRGIGKRVDVFVKQLEEVMTSARCVSQWTAAAGGGAGQGGAGYKILMLLYFEAVRECLMVKRVAVGWLLRRVNPGRGDGGGDVDKIVELAAKIRCTVADSHLALEADGVGLWWQKVALDLYAFSVCARWLRASDESRPLVEEIEALRGCLRGGDQLRFAAGQDGGAEGRDAGLEAMLAVLERSSDGGTNDPRGAHRGGGGGCAWLQLVNHAVCLFWPRDPQATSAVGNAVGEGGKEAGVRAEMAGIYAEIVSPAASGLQSHPYEMDPRLPYKFRLEIDVRGMANNRIDAISVLLTLADGSWQLLAFHQEDTIRPDSNEEDRANGQHLTRTVTNGDTCAELGRGWMEWAGAGPVCRVRGHCYLEISEAWSRAGFVHMQAARVVSGVDASVLALFGQPNVCLLGPSRRFLVLPEEKARTAPSKVLA